MTTTERQPALDLDALKVERYTTAARLESIEERIDAIEEENEWLPEPGERVDVVSGPYVGLQGTFKRSLPNGWEIDLDYDYAPILDPDDVARQPIGGAA